MRHFNRNVNIRNNEVRDQRFSGTNLHPAHPHSVNTVPTNDPRVGVFPPESIGIGPLGMNNISSSNSLPENIHQRFSGRLFGSINPSLYHRSGGNSITPINDHYNAAVLPNYEIPTAAGPVGNNHYSINQVQNMSSGLYLHPYGPQNQSGNSSSSTDLNAINSTGVPGNVAVQGQQGVGGTRRLPLKRRSTECAFTQFETGESSNSTRMQQAGIPKRRAATAPVINNNDNLNISTPRNGYVVSNLQNLNETGQSHSLQSNINLEAAVRSNMLSSTVYNRSDSRVQLPNQQMHPFPQYGNYPPFFGTSQTPVSAIPFPYVPYFPFMRQRIALPVMEGSEARVPFYNPRYIHANSMFNPQIGVGSWSHNQGNFSFFNGNLNFHGGFPHTPHQYGAVHGMFQQSNIGEWFIRWLNVHQQHRMMLLGSVSPSIVFPQQINLSQSSQENFPTGFGNNSISENQAGDSFVRTTWNEIRRAIEYLENGGALPFEELLANINNSIRSNLLEEQRDINEQEILDNLPLYESMFSLEAGMLDNVGMGLDEEEILLHIGREIFHSITEGSPQNTEACVICQEDYVNGEELGRLDCEHKFHIACIKQWLVRQNTCPICKQIALTIEDEDEEDDDDEEGEEDDK